MILQVGNVCGIVTDNARANKSAWAILEKSHPSIYFYGCIAHTLHLLVKDIFKLNTFNLLEQLAKSIIKFFKHHQREAYQLAELREKGEIESLKLPGATRWGSLLQCFRSLIKSRHALREIVTSAGFESDKDSRKLRDQKAEIKRNVVNPQLFVQFETLYLILEPINKWIDYFQDDSKMISDAFHVFVDLKQKFAKMESDHVILPEINTHIQACLAKRWDAGYCDVHGLSYLLDPRYRGSEMEEDNKKRTMEVLQQAGLEREYEFYKEKCNTMNKTQSEMLKDGSITVRRWLNMFEPKEIARLPLLHSLLVRVFNCVPSSASCERNFSNFGFISTKYRTRLKKETLRKLGYIYSNYRALGEHYDQEVDIPEEDQEDEQQETPARFTLDFAGFADIDNEYEEEDID
jgi:hypothetical protein